MAILMPDQIDDIVESTIVNYLKKSWVDLSLPYQSYAAASKLLSGKRMSEDDGSYAVNWKVQYQNTGSFRSSGLFDTDQLQVKNLLIGAQENWAKVTVNYIYDVDEPLFNSGINQIVDELAVRAHAMMNDFWEGMETQLWSAPTSPTQDPRPFNGIPFWIQKDATTTPGGAFNGGNPSGFTSGAGGISSSTYTAWKNWTFGWTNFTEDDLLTKLAKACEFTKFKAPDPYNQLGKETGDFDIFTTYNVVEQAQRHLRKINDNLSLGKYRNEGVAFRSAPLIWVPYLQDNDTSDPLYGVNWNVFKCKTKAGRWMHKYKPQINADSHTVREVHMDSWGQNICLNRRACFVGSKS